MEKIIAFAGSLRKESWNKKLLAVAVNELESQGKSVEVINLDGIPLYNGDMEQNGFPPAVKAFRDTISSAEKILVATPEYNHGMPGVLKNAFDWASRDPNVVSGKVVAVIGASTGAFATARAQIQMRVLLVALNAWLVPQPYVLVPNAKESFDASGALVNERAAKSLKELMARFANVRITEDNA